MSDLPRAFHTCCRTRDRSHPGADDRSRPRAVGDAQGDARHLRGELLTVTDEIYELMPALRGRAARRSSRSAMGTGHGRWRSPTRSRGDRVLVLDSGVFARVWAEMAEFDGLRCNARGGRRRRQRSGSGRGAASCRHHTVDQGGPDGAHRHGDIGQERRVSGAGRTRRRRSPGVADRSTASRRWGASSSRWTAWGVDVTLAASQKGLMTPPGLGFVWAGPRALEAHRTADMRTRYWDWTFRLQEGPQYLRFCGTAPVTHIFGFREALRMIEEEGLERAGAGTTCWPRRSHAAVHSWSAPDGLSLFVTPRAPRRLRDHDPNWLHRRQRVVVDLSRHVWCDVGGRVAPPRRLRVPYRPHGPRQCSLDARRRRCRRVRPPGDGRPARRIGHVAAAAAAIAPELGVA